MSKVQIGKRGMCSGGLPTNVVLKFDRYIKIFQALKKRLCTACLVRKNDVHVNSPSPTNMRR